MSLVPDVKKLGYYTFDQMTLLGASCLISRTGYTGELGYEIYYPWEKAKELWKTFLKNDKVKPTGLGVRDVLRIEMGFSLYGHELEEHISPLDAGLNKFLDWNKDFIGRAALLEQKQSGVKRGMGCFVSDSRRSPRAGHKIYDAQQNKIGLVTSGTFSPALQGGIGMGFIDAEHSAIGGKIIFGDEKSKGTGTLIQRPFYKNGTLKT